jgi:hypothetical protein
LLFVVSMLLIIIKIIQSYIHIPKIGFLEKKNRIQ